MTVPSTAISAGPFFPNGSTTTFPFSFRAISAGEVQAVNSATGAVISPSLYSVTLTPTGGSVVFNAAPTVGAIPELMLYADPDFTQEISFGAQEAFLPQAHNQALDRAAMRSLVLADGIARSLTVPRGEAPVSLPPAEDRAGLVLGFDDDGAPIATNAGIGTPGKSAYQVAVTNGFTGTEAEWLASLQASVSRIAIEAALGGPPLLRSDLPEYRITDYYTSPSTTDSEALQAFFDTVQTNARLVFKPGAGRNGGGGAYGFNGDIGYNRRGHHRIEIDGMNSRFRYLSTGTRIRYSPMAHQPYTDTDEAFIVRNVQFRAAATISHFLYWEMPWVLSRGANTTGYMENCRFVCDDLSNPAHAFASAVKLKNTWQFSAQRCFAMRGALPGVGASAGAFIKQEGHCVVTQVTNTSEAWYFDCGVSVSWVNLVAIDGSFGGATFARGLKITQGSAVGYFGHSTAVSGPHYSNYPYTLYDVTGTFTNGACNVYSEAGALIGTFTITRSAAFSMPSEAVNIDGGASFVEVNFGVFSDMPATIGDYRQLHITLGNCHMAFRKSAVYARRCATLNAGSGFNPQCQQPNCTTFDVDTCGLFTIHDIASTTNQPGANGCTFAKVRNSDGFQIGRNVLAFYQKPIDLDVTCTRFLVADNVDVAGTNGGFVSTAKRLSTEHPEGGVFRNNGAMGRGYDADGQFVESYTPGVTPLGGTFGALTTTARFTQDGNQIDCEFNALASDLGTATGPVRFSLPFPALLSTSGCGDNRTLGQSLVVYADATTSEVVVTRQNGADPFTASGQTIVFSIGYKRANP